jgi:hypothetical protein
MIQLRDNFFAAEVPEETVHYELYNKEDHPLAVMVYLKDKMFKPGLPVPIQIDPGTWQIVCTSKEARIKDVTSIIETDGDLFFKCYHGNRSHIDATGSFKCLLTSKGCDTNKNWLILKKQ